MVKDWTLLNGICLSLLMIQVPAALIMLSRIFKGAIRHSPIEPQNPTPDLLGKVSVVVPTLNEAQRISPLLAGLTRQTYEVKEIIVVDSNSKDGTPNLVKTAGVADPRFKVITDDPLPSDWVGRPWALHNGFLHSSQTSEWFLGMDADIQPSPKLVSSLVQTAITHGYDLVSLSPKFILKYPGECWLQPALLMTLLYRFESAGVDAQAPQRVMANGQCYLCRRSVLASVGGYTSAKSSFCDDVTLARNIASAGFKVGFLDGAKVLKVRMYEGALQTWQEWGRSLDLKDASSRAQTWGDLWLLTSVQGLPLSIVLSYFIFKVPFDASFSFVLLLLILNIFLLLVRFGMLFAIAASYNLSQAIGAGLFWFSPLADPLAVVRILLSAAKTPREWRGRKYTVNK